MLQEPKAPGVDAAPLTMPETRDGPDVGSPPGTEGPKAPPARSDPAPDPAAPSRDPHRALYVAVMASVALVDIGITGIFMLVAERGWVFLQVALISLAVFGVLGAGAGWLLFRPLHDYLGNLDPRKRSRARRRLEALPILSSVVVALLTMSYCAIVFSLGVFAEDPARLASLPPGLLLAATLWYLAVYASCYGFFAYFAVSDIVAGVKVALQRHGALTPRAGKGRFVRRLGLVLVVVAVLPNLLIAGDLTIFAPIRAAQGLTITQTIALDLMTVAFVVCVSLYFVTRGLQRPVAELLETMGRVRSGDLDARAHVMTDDEIGRLTAGFNAMCRGLKERAELQETFGRYVSTDVMAAIVREGGRPRSETRTATVMFTDIQGFTTLSESLSPTQTAEILNEYFTVTTEPIMKFRGLVNNYIGDAICAVFNVPEDDPEHATHAVEAAIAMQRALAGRTFRGHALPTRIGVHTGVVVAGAVGSDRRLGYTVYGDAVNLAARLEPMNKEFGTRIIISEATVSLAGPVATFQHLGTVPVRGRANPVTVYTV